MKRVAPTEIQGPHCVRVREGKECVRLSRNDACALYGVTLAMAASPTGGIPMKCESCVNALAELGDR